MIVLARHASTYGGKGFCIGRTVLPLSREGRQQALELADALGNAGIVGLFSSPISRALETIQPLSEQIGITVHSDMALAEIDMGEWDGRTFEAIQAEDPVGYAERGKNFASFRAPGGESFNDVADRAMEFLSNVDTVAGPVLLMTHAGVIRSLLCRITGHPLDDLFHFKPGHAQCTLLDGEGDGFRLAAENISPVEAASFL